MQTASTSTDISLASAHPLGPAPEARFLPRRARELLSEALRSRLAGCTSYQPDESNAGARDLADEIREKLKAEPSWGGGRYKFCVQVLIGEQRGEGCKFASQQFWDNDTDAYAFESFSNAHVFATAAAFAVWTP